MGEATKLPPMANSADPMLPTSWEEDGCTVYRTSARTAPGCHDCCGVLLHVRDGKLVRIEGDPENPYNQGRLCPRCLAATEMIYNEKRLKRPMVRAKDDRGKDAFKEIGWDEAYDIIERELSAVIDEYGNEAIYVTQGTGRDINGYTGLTSLYLGTPNSGCGFLSGIACYAPRMFSTAIKAGDLYIADYSQFSPKRYDDPRWLPPEVIMVIGNNPVVANSDGTLGHWVVECMKRGSRLVVVDPKLTWLAGKADYWIPVRPGTDAALLFGMCNQIIEDGLEDAEFVAKWTFGYDEFKEAMKQYPLDKVAKTCDVDPKLVKEASRFVGNAKRAALQWGVALDQSSEGFFAGIAAFDLMALTGNFEKPGTMICSRPPYGVTQTWQMDQHAWDGVADPIPHPEKVITGGYPGLMAMQTASPDAMLTALETGDPYPVKAVWMQTNNPISCMGAEPERVLRALQGTDFNVVVDIFMTPTAMACADVVLPAASFAERYGLAGHEPYFLSTIVPAIDPYYEARSDQRIIYDLGKRFRGKGYDLWDDEKGFYDWILRNSGFTWDALHDRNWAYPELEYNKIEKGKLRPDGKPGFPTSTGLYNFYSPELAAMGFPPVGGYEEPVESPVSTPDELNEYPYVLITGARRWGYFHSEHRQSPSMRRLHPDPVVDMHPETASENGLSDGDWCDVVNKHGRARMKVCTKEVIRRDVVSCDHGWWFPERDAGDGTLFGTFESNASSLVPMRPGKIGLGAEYKSQLCRLEKVEEAA